MQDSMKKLPLRPVHVVIHDAPQEGMIKTIDDLARFVRSEIKPVCHGKNDVIAYRRGLIERSTFKFEKMLPIQGGAATAVPHTHRDETHLVCTEATNIPTLFMPSDDLPRAVLSLMTDSSAHIQRLMERVLLKTDRRSADALVGEIHAGRGWNDISRLIGQLDDETSLRIAREIQERLDHPIRMDWSEFDFIQFRRATPHCRDVTRTQERASGAGLFDLSEWQIETLGL